MQAAFRFQFQRNPKEIEFVHCSTFANAYVTLSIFEILPLLVEFGYNHLQSAKIEELI